MLLERSVEGLYMNMQHLSKLLDVDLTLAVRLAFKVPALAVQKPEDLEARMQTLAEVGGAGPTY